ncbi:hypothetical protein [Synoicihabitans lomoniglobus]|uniref:DUF2339 domain-containing protein n=1 Tax=Synoicihabitans lomoniglobus TaxID=2909285 RepID=A0AAF0CRN2_9BACT|nr:hypothetical protein [Opitutaceae bacterium LMO-M01]WED66842.1 hypothetical protein PXH66_08265 [Opitutaceae bacterium LMO-M01]
MMIRFKSLLLVVVALAVLAGCSKVPRSLKPAIASVTAGSTAVQQSGAAEVPARAEVNETVRTVPVPKGSEIVTDADTGNLRVIISEPTLLTETRRNEVSEAPQSFKPAAPPSPSDIANGRAVWFFRIGLGLGIALAVFGLVRGWDFVMYGGAAVAAGCGLSLFLQRNPLLAGLIGAGVLAAVVGPILWHWKLKRFPDVNAPG